MIQEYQKRQRDYEERVADLAATTAKRDEAKAALEALRKQRLDEFMTGFHAISMKLKEMYQMITLGGNAELELGDSLDPFSEGINFSVMPPKKVRSALDRSTLIRARRAGRTSAICPAARRR